MYYEDNTVLGAKYDDVLEVKEELQLLDVRGYRRWR